jgi:hypothetical protein
MSFHTIPSVYSFAGFLGYAKLAIKAWMRVMFGLDEREAPPQVRLRAINEP